MSGEGVYTSSESEDDDPTLQQQVYVPIIEEPPEMIVFGETAKKFREYAEQAGLLRRSPVTINVVNFPRGRVAHGVWKQDSARRQQAPEISSMIGGHQKRETGGQSGRRVNGHLLNGRGGHTRSSRDAPTVPKPDIERRHACGASNDAIADRLVERLGSTGGAVRSPREMIEEARRSSALEQIVPKCNPPSGLRNTLILDVLPLANAFMHFDQGDIGVCLERFNVKTLEFEWEAEPMHAIASSTLCLKNLYIYGTDNLKKEKLYEECEMKTALDLLKLPAFNRNRGWNIARKLTIKDVSRSETRGAGKFIDTINECFEEVDFCRVRGFKYNIELVLQRSLSARTVQCVTVQKCDITFPTLQLISGIFKQKQCEEVHVANNSVDCRLPFFKDVFDSILTGASEGPSKKFSMSYPSSEKAVIEAYVVSKSLRMDGDKYACRSLNHNQFYVHVFFDSVSIIV
ncbi:hypothetical protein QR680_018987 [Steinernema hermaphroditum]|uniref:Uncharacterized protein n=1 Tax=Steinernema hermaphroditum TaxID=289476 RepID=A0AA39LR69_9BILA|nr:hypothetical protein QR680_018987 [Steinernema hermaphroditum]